MDNNTVEVIKEHIKKGGPPYELGKDHILKMCDKLGIKTISRFYDVLYNALRCGCDRNFWQHPQGQCLDDEGTHIAYGKDEISQALGKPEKDLTCEDICVKCGSCAYINIIDYNLFVYLIGLMDDERLTLDDR